MILSRAVLLPPDDVEPAAPPATAFALLAPVVLGCCVQLVLYGLLISSFTTYLTTSWSTTTRPTRCVILLVVALTTLSTALYAGDIVHFSTLQQRDGASLLKGTLRETTEALWSVIYYHEPLLESNSHPTFNQCVGIWLGSAAGADLIISGTFIVCLRQRLLGHDASTDTLVRRISKIVLQSAAFTALFAVPGAIVSIIFNGNSLNTTDLAYCFWLPLSGLYSLSLFTTLNLREKMRTPSQTAAERSSRLGTRSNQSYYRARRTESSAGTKVGTKIYFPHKRSLDKPPKMRPISVQIDTWIDEEVDIEEALEIGMDGDAGRSEGEAKEKGKDPASPDAIYLMAKADLLTSPFVPSPSWVPTVGVSVKFPKIDKSVTPGEYLVPSETKPEAPAVTIETTDSGATYTLVMVDPDAPTRSDSHYSPIRHLVVTGLKGGEWTAEVGETLSSYIGPNPPVKTGYHRYIFLVYENTLESGLLPEQRTIPGNEIMQRIQWDFAGFVEENKLKLVGVNFFEAQNPEQ
ncbi:PEBP-like protein [Pseudohyphozyma bogoriensis]|nr:PEBP-like protein [Pseudohyphozyma bogoriensis]